MNKKRVIPYGVGNYAELVEDHSYFVDNGYAAGLQQEFPHAQIERYVIYCFGNQGYRVFAVT